MALEQVSSVVKSTYLNNVAGYEIQYNIAQDEGQSVKSVTGTIKKADVRFGYININVDGTLNISIDKPIPEEDSTAIYIAALADAKNIFTQRNIE
ncbi:hypothetical protein [Parabacteroides chongii]|uniref:hypothetical protein n=1 Tax=Parabacteroides chongii TaxID=2685834 RepID=UPI00240E1C60|nr:hypothetical protein [Parabacteroides chongii]WFE84972.1 hypothetical protein P3L47_23115 [Parabacteroides chongii]WFE85034.1 hypothetical protein P3L47_00030 [Parabacteroides chongii]